MAAFATYGDYVLRHGEPSDEERAKAMLSDASSFLLARLGKRFDPASPVLMANLRTVCCAMAARALSTECEAGVTQSTETAGVYSQTFTYAGATSTLYVTAEERRMLGIGSTRVGAIRPTIGGE